MAKFKSLIVGAKFEVASRKTTCKHDKKHVITKGEFRLSVRIRRKVNLTIASPVPKRWLLKAEPN
jgi:hypothetical protein